MDFSIPFLVTCRNRYGAVGHPLAWQILSRIAYARPYHLWREANGTWHKIEIPFTQGSALRSKLVFDAHNNAYLVLPDLRIVAASAAARWTDWRLVFAGEELSIGGEFIIDRQRVRTENVLSILYQEANDGLQPSAIYLIDFQLSVQEPYQSKSP